MNMIKTRLGAIFVLLLFLFSVVPIMAEDSAVTSGSATPAVTATADSGGTSVSATEATAIRNRILEKRVFANLGEAEKNRLKKLNITKIEKLEQLDGGTIKTIAGLPVGRIRAITKMSPQDIRLLKGLDEQEIKKLAYLDSARAHRVFGNVSVKGLPKVKAQLAQYVLQKVNPEKQFKARVIAEKNLTEADEAYEAAEEKYNEEKARFSEERRLFNEARAAGDENAALEHAKKYLAHTAELIIAMLERVKEKVNANDDLTDDEANEIVAKIDAKIQEMTDAKAKVEAAATKEEVKEAGKIVLDSWKNIKQQIKEYVARLVQTKVKEIIERSEQLEKKLDETLADMEAQGIDVAGIDEKVSLFSLRIDEARTKYKKSVELFEKAKEVRETNPKTAAELVRQSRLLATEAHSALKEAHKLLKEIVKDIKEAGGTIKEVADEENYEVVEAQE